MYKNLPVSDIKIDSIWAPNDGGSYRVKVTDIQGDEVYYTDINRPWNTYSKASFNFQVRYHLVGSTISSRE